MQHERRGVQVAADSIRLLADRLGPCDTADIPRAIRRHQWSAMNVSLMWAAAAGDRSHPVLQWWLEVSATIPEMTVVGIDMTGQVAVTIGWEALRDALRSRGTRSHEDLADWIHAQGFSMPRWGAHFSARAQILNQAIVVMPESTVWSHCL